MSGFSKTNRWDRSSNSGTIILHVRDDIPSRLLTEYKVLQDIEGMFVELNVRNKMSWNEHIYDLKIKNFISWSQLGHILSSKNMGASALGCKML